MSRSRYGGLRVGKSRLFSDWLTRRSNSSSANAPTSIQDFSYTDAQGIWSLRSTMQFPKAASSGGSYEIGLSDSLLQTSGGLNAWTQKTIDISAYAGATVRVVFKYTMIASVFTADYQLDAVAVDGTTSSFENTGESFQTSTTNTASYDGVSWSNVGTGTTAGRFNVDSGGTPTSNTGRTDAAAGSYYVYAETSSPANSSGFTFWLRSPEIVLSGSPTLSFYEARFGTSVGTTDVYLDVIS